MPMPDDIVENTLADEVFNSLEVELIFLYNCSFKPTDPESRQIAL